MQDLGENVSKMEPLLIPRESEAYHCLLDIEFELMAKSTALKSAIPADIVEALAILVRTMNCYYSNLIEGHNTHPVDIEKAMAKDFSHDKTKRDLQLEACAHIEVQRWLEKGELNDPVTSAEGLKQIHEHFCKLLPNDLLIVEGESVVPGQFRTKFVQVGKHVAVSPGAILRFLDRYSSVYQSLSKTESLLSVPAAHHRLLWVHPFMDGNGRVARLVSHVQLFKLLDTGGIWSFARGLARTEREYKSHLMACDAARYNDLDGRGNLSLKALVEFTDYFLRVCIDQVDFMSNLIEPGNLRNRILFWAQQQVSSGLLPQHSIGVMEAILYRGSLSRSEVPVILGLTDRQARRITSVLLEKGILTSKSDKSPFKLAFPAALASQWMPGLFPSA